MKKLFFILSLLSFGTVANERNDFNFDQNKVNKSFEKLTLLESMLDSNTVTDVAVDKIVPNLDKSSAIDDKKELPAGIPAFWWGFCLGVAGLIVVLLITDNDDKQVRKAVLGCLLGIVFSVAVSILINLATGNI